LSIYPVLHLSQKP